MTPKRRIKRRDKFRRTLKITSGVEMAMPREVEVMVEERKEAENGKQGYFLQD